MAWRYASHLEMVPCSKRPSLSPTPNHSMEMNGYSSFSQYLPCQYSVVVRYMRV